MKNLFTLLFNDPLHSKQISYILFCIAASLQEISTKRFIIKTQKENTLNSILLHQQYNGI